MKQPQVSHMATCPKTTERSGQMYLDKKSSSLMSALAGSLSSSDNNHSLKLIGENVSSRLLPMSSCEGTKCGREASRGFSTLSWHIVACLVTLSYEENLKHSL